VSDDPCSDNDAPGGAPRDRPRARARGAELPSAAEGYGRHIGVTTTALALWAPGSPARRTELAALMVHEYGHLLGYCDATAYTTDPRRVMFEYSNYLTLPGGALPRYRVASPARSAP
jgi:hypothetical protein